MEKKMQHSSWWLLDHTPPYHSYSIQNTISDLDKKMEKILQVVDNGGDKFAERAEMYYQKRPQLIQMLQNLHSSYRDLATKYDLLLMSPSSSTTDSTLSGGADESVGGGFPTPSSDILDDDDDDEMEKDKWKKLKMEVSKLMEDNLCHQKELIKRNEEKRDLIKRLKNENRLLKDSLQRRMMKKQQQQQPSPSQSSLSSSSYSKFKKSVFGVFFC